MTRGRLNAGLRELAKLLYSPFKASYIGKYGDMENKYLTAELQKTCPPVSKDIVDELRNVGSSVLKFMAVLSGASNRCFDFTEGEESSAMGAGGRRTVVL